MQDAKSLALLKAATQAGFKITHAQSMETLDGISWKATLTRKSTGIVTAYDAGRGGAIDLQMVASSDRFESAMQELYAIPEVLACAQEYLAIGASTPLNLTPASPELRSDEVVGVVIGSLYDAAEIAKLYRPTVKKGLLAWIEEPLDAAEGKERSLSCQASDTPENREKLIETRAGKARVLAFINDLIKV